MPSFSGVYEPLPVPVPLQNLRYLQVPVPVHIPGNCQTACDNRLRAGPLRGDRSAPGFQRRQVDLKIRTLINFFVRTDIDQYNLCPALVNKIENEAMLVRNPERPESFQDPAQCMGFE